MPLLLLLIVSGLGAAEWIDRLVDAWSSASTVEARAAAMSEQGPWNRERVLEIGRYGEKVLNGGDPRRAERIFRVQREAAVAAGDQAQLSIAHNWLGVALRRQGRYAEAEVELRKALEILEGHPSTLSRSLVLNNLAVVLATAARYSEALPLLQENLAGAAPRTAASIHQNIGLILAQQGNFASSAEHLFQALQIYTAEKDQRGMALTNHNLGVLERKQNNAAAAESYFATALGLARGMKNRSQEADVLIELARLNQQRGRTVEARKAYTDALLVYQALGVKPGVAETTLALGDLELQVGRLDAALERFQDALAQYETLGDRHYTAAAHRSIGAALLRRGDLEGATARAERAISIAREVGDVEAEWRGMALAGTVLRKSRKLGEARQQLQGAADLIETQRDRVAGSDQERQLYFESAAEPYYDLIELAAAAGERQEALLFAERTRARTLLDILARGPRKANESLTAEESKQYQTLLARLAKLNAGGPGVESQRRDVRKQIDAFTARVQASRPGVQMPGGSVPGLTREALARLTPQADGCVLVYSTGQQATWLFVLERSGVSAYPLALAGERLTAAVERFRSALAARDPAFRTQAEELHRVLLGPATRHLAGKKSLRVLPDGALWDLPFQALVTPSGKFVVEEIPVQYAPSLAVLVELQKARPGKPAMKPLLALGGQVSVETPRALQELPELYHGGSVVTEATEAAFRQLAPSHRVLHVTAHGVLNAANPMYSQLQLRGAERPRSVDEDGVLEAWEILRMPLGADLAVLSACESGRGRIARGEGVIGLSWAFFVAGVPTVVVSQWKVAEIPTTGLMRTLHREYARGRPAAEALRLAAMGLMQNAQYRHPFYWAGFIAVGR